MELEFIDNKNQVLISRAFLKKFLLFVEKKLLEKNIFLEPKKKLTVVVLPSKNIQKLNKEFLGKNSVTDVMSFSSFEKNSLGEIALCIEKIKSQAEDHNLNVQEETAYLVLHGLLHLLGYHHEQGGESAKIMYEIQDDIFQQWQNHFNKSDFY